ncbi:hypothetical protein EI42_06199 [Thermosporothrix hazakensis]|jgi:hypothetical protein|uniref:Uncharacterized protein n=2 Tax=Thermosporothrix TaxID=768650 RepID=A0A326TTN9_THEHA|nr:hypothetical protein EI42_06199 [Thermosporothrix hazakensis]BBH89701.1 hypothetical protein KTC_44520 [Thermosporothrix sp. COM3]GCE47888.1 hypothetical protein KTH_27570 [Thermosporothrix hazakensis]
MCYQVYILNFHLYMRFFTFSERGETDSLASMARVRFSEVTSLLAQKCYFYSPKTREHPSQE